MSTTNTVTARRGVHVASQPCRKCGIDVDPDIQDSCPSCGRKIDSSYRPPPPVVEPEWEPGDELPPPPPPAADPQVGPDWTQYETPTTDAPARSSGGFLSSIGVRLLIGLVFFGGFSAWNAINSADRDDTGAIVGEGELAATDLKVGDCLMDPGEGSFEEVTGVACSQPHDFEIFHLATLAGGSYPTDTEFDNAAFQHCVPAFDFYTGQDYESSELWIGYFIPDPTGWRQGDRELQCYLYLPDRMLTTSSAR